ncbi:glutamate ABC transporter substrate-binding protein [Actinoplanes sp. TBRC 11911]|nr:glutamate ABC transporter substrate-binding protein [Actinoplanes sp. TBRC 11911]
MRRRVVAVIASLALLGLAAGCAGDSSTLDRPKPQAAPGHRMMPAQPTPPAQPGEAQKTDESCNPRASVRPTTPLPPPGKMPAGTYMAKIQKDGRLILGTSQDTLLFSSRNPLTGRVEGFDVDMGRQIAQAIFGDPDKIQIKVIAYDDRVDAPRNGDVHIVADTMTANCARWKDVNFSSIYYEAGQKVLVSTNSPAKSIEDLGGKRICSAAGSTSYDNIAKVKTKPIPVAMPAFGDCLVAFQLGQVDAISTDDTILAGMAAQDPFAKVIGPRFTEEPYAMAMSADHPEFTAFVNAVLQKNRENGTWAATYKKWLGAFGPAPKPPAAQYK